MLLFDNKRLKMEDYFWLIAIGIVILIIIISSLHPKDNNHIEYKDKNHNVNKVNKNNSVKTNPYIFRETHSIENIYDYISCSGFNTTCEF